MFGYICPIYTPLPHLIYLTKCWLFVLHYDDLQQIVVDFPTLCLDSATPQTGNDSNFYWNTSEGGGRYYSVMTIWTKRPLKLSITPLRLHETWSNCLLGSFKGRVTRLDTCNCTASNLNKECGGLPGLHTHTHTHTQKQRQKQSTPILTSNTSTVNC